MFPHSSGRADGPQSASSGLRTRKDVLERLPTTTNQQVAQLTPLNWKNFRQQEFKQAA